VYVITFINLLGNTYIRTHHIIYIYVSRVSCVYTHTSALCLSIFFVVCLYLYLCIVVYLFCILSTISVFPEPMCIIHTHTHTYIYIYIYLYVYVYVLFATSMYILFYLHSRENFACTRWHQI